MNLFVAKLNPVSTSEDLQKLFAHYGHVSAVRVILDKETGNSKRYGFVEMPNETEAKEALKELNETEFQESMIVVKESQPHESQVLPRGQSNFSQRRDSQRGGNSGIRSFNRRNQSQRSFVHDNMKNQGNPGQRSYGNRY
jgi:RNA recognition motif-containing protein